MIYEKVATIEDIFFQALYRAHHDAPLRAAGVP